MEKAEAREKERLKAEERKVCSLDPLNKYGPHGFPCLCLATKEGGLLQECAEECRPSSAGIRQMGRGVCVCLGTEVQY